MFSVTEGVCVTFKAWVQLGFYWQPSSHLLSNSNNLWVVFRTCTIITVITLCGLFSLLKLYLTAPFIHFSLTAHSLVAPSCVKCLCTVWTRVSISYQTVPDRESTTVSVCVFSVCVCVEDSRSDHALMSEIWQSGQDQHESCHTCISLRPAVQTNM